jgi:hypothetical protein
MLRAQIISRLAMAATALWLVQTSAASPFPTMPASELVRKTVQNEVAASQGSPIRHMFTSRKETGHGSQTKLYCETTEAMAGLAIANDDKPLTPQQRQDEEVRLQALIQNPEELRRKHQKEKDDAERIGRIVRAMSDAFLYDYDGVESGQTGLGKPGSELVRLKFRPNPAYIPPTRTEQVLTGMHGNMLIDPQALRIARIDGTLFKEVGFGWGILGHLDKGGHFLVQQGDVGDGSWDMQRMSLAFTGKILLFKRIDIKSTEILSDFHPVPRDLTFAQGVEMLKKQESMLAQDGHGAGYGSRNADPQQVPSWTRRRIRVGRHFTNVDWLCMDKIPISQLEPLPLLFRTVFSPLVEEIEFRGFGMRQLQRGTGWTFWIAVYLWIVSFLTVNFSTKSSRTRYPVPASSRMAIKPSRDTSTSGSMMSSFQ